MPGVVRNGNFDFRVAPGSYMLMADYFDAGKRLTARVPVDVGATDIDNIAVHLDSGFTVTGMVRVVSQSGQTTAPQFGVGLRPSEPGSNTGQMKWEPDHSSFAISEMVPGSFRLDVNPPAPFYVKSAMLAGQDILNNDVPISQAAGPIEIVLRDDGGSIEGDVVDANGQPVSAGVMLLRGTIRVASLMSQPTGHFKIQNVAPGDYTIYAWDDPNEVAYADSDWMRQKRGRWHGHHGDRESEPADQADLATGPPAVVCFALGSVFRRRQFHVIDHDHGEHAFALFEPEAELLVDGFAERNSAARFGGLRAGLG